MSEQATVASPADVYNMASCEKRLGSRITRKQITAVLGTELPPDVSYVRLAEYAMTGEALDTQNQAALKAFVDKCKAHPILENESQRRRLWPRKVAAILAFTD